MRRIKALRALPKTIIALFLAVAVFIFCFPVLFLVTGSFMGQPELNGHLAPVLSDGKGFIDWSLLPLYPTLRSYIELLVDSPEFFPMFWNSILIVVGVLVGQLLIAVPAAWGFAKYEFRGKNALFLLYVVLMMMPFQVLMLSEYLVLDTLGMIDTLWAIILPGIFSTFSVFIMHHFFKSIPSSLMESARIDGASEFTIFLRVGVPLGMPGILAALMLTFLEYWNLVEQPLVFLRDKALWPLSLFLPTIGLEQAGVAFVAAVVALVPSLLVFFAGKDYLEQGIASTATKG
jgi:multiple sugar transport system permease protein